MDYGSTSIHPTICSPRNLQRSTRSGRTTNHEVSQLPATPTFQKIGEERLTQLPGHARARRQPSHHLSLPRGPWHPCSSKPLAPQPSPASPKPLTRPVLPGDPVSPVRCSLRAPGCPRRPRTCQPSLELPEPAARSVHPPRPKPLESACAPPRPTSTS